MDTLVEQTVDLVGTADDDAANIDNDEGTKPHHGRHSRQKVKPKTDSWRAAGVIPHVGATARKQLDVSRHSTPRSVTTKSTRTSCSSHGTERTTCAANATPTASACLDGSPSSWSYQPPPRPRRPPPGSNATPGTMMRSGHAGDTGSTALGAAAGSTTSTPSDRQAPRRGPRSTSPAPAS